MQGAGLSVGVDPVVAVGNALDVGAVGNHGDDHGCLGHCLSDGLGATASVLDEPVDCCPPMIDADDVVAGVDEVAGHGFTHDPESDERDGRHVSPEESVGGGQIPRTDAPRRSWGNHVKLVVVVSLGTYSNPTQSEYPAFSSAARCRSRSRCPVPGSWRPGASAICT